MDDIDPMNRPAIDRRSVSIGENHGFGLDEFLESVAPAVAAENSQPRPAVAIDMLASGYQRAAGNSAGFGRSVPAKAAERTTSNTMTRGFEMTERNPAPPDEASALEALANVVSETYFRLKEFGEVIGLTHEYGSNVSTVLSMLLDRETMTVSEVAKIRGVSRQFAIKLARQLEADGIVQLSRRPGSRGYFMQLTRKGIAEVRARSAQFRSELAKRSVGLDVERLMIAQQALADFRQRLAGHSDDGPA